MTLLKTFLFLLRIGYTCGRMIAAGFRNHPLDHVYTRGPDFPYWTAGCLLRGSAVVSTTHGHTMIGAPALGLTRPGVAYRAEFGGVGRVWSEYWVIFAPRPEWARWMDWPEILPGVTTLPMGEAASRKEVVDAFVEVHRLSTRALPERDALMHNAMERFLLLGNALNPRTPRGRMDTRVREVMEQVLADPARAWSVEQMARVAHLSPSRLAHLFRARVGESPAHFVERHRLRRAQELLVSGDTPIRQIALEVGFENPYHFSTRFRKHFGRSPRQYRQHPNAPP